MGSALDGTIGLVRASVPLILGVIGFLPAVVTLTVGAAGGVLAVSWYQISWSDAAELSERARARFGCNDAPCPVPTRLKNSRQRTT